MRREQWEWFKSAAKKQPLEAPPLALIVDSPWMPGFLGVSQHAFYLDPEVWHQSYLRLMTEFPDVIWFPSWWVEYGMAIEPSTLGARVHFRPDQPPGISPSLHRLEDIERISAVDPQTDGFMSLALERYRMQKQRIFDAGFTIPVVAARGPLCTAAFSRGLNEFMMDIIDNPEGTRRLLEFTTALTIDWLRAQAEAIGECVEGIFVLDDIVGFLSRDLYREFAHPCLHRLFEAFPRDWVKVYHNDANIKPMLEDLPGTGFDVLNWGKNIDITEVSRRTGGLLALMGNVNPLEIATRGTPEEVRRATLNVLAKAPATGMILSLGGGVSPGMPRASLEAMVGAWREFCGRK